MKTNKEIITEIIEDLEQTVGLNWPKRSDANVTREKLIECWSITNKHEYSYFKCASNTITKSLGRIFKLLDKPKVGGLTYKNYILENYGYKYCNKCNIIKNIYEFSHIKTKNTSYNSMCKPCNKDYKYNYNLTKDGHSLIIANNAKRRASKLQRTPSWVNYNEIRDFYIKCPEGYHVDHKIPLQGKLVSGLHVPENLQYLTASENLSKGNRYNIE